MQNQTDMKCEGCGQQFSNRNELEKHQQNCSAYKSKAGSTQNQGQGRPQTSSGQKGSSSQQQGSTGQQGQPRTHGAGGSHNP